MSEFWLASKSYSNAPEYDPDDTKDGTDTPIKVDYDYTVWNGKKVEDAAAWLKELPSDRQLDAHHFAILDKRAAEDETMVICRVGTEKDGKLQGDELDYLRFPANEAAVHLGGMEPDMWDGFSDGGRGSAKIEY